MHAKHIVVRANVIVFEKGSERHKKINHFDLNSFYTTEERTENVFQLPGTRANNNSAQTD